MIKIEYDDMEEMMKKENNNENCYYDIFEIQEKERQRIARELHDSTVQNLTHLVHAMELTSLYMDKDLIQAKLELQSCQENLKKCIDDIRNIIFNLRPMSFDDFGFVRCLTDYIQNLKISYPSICFEYEIDETAIHLSEQGQLILFRIIQEAIQNAIKHSHTDRIELHIEKTHLQSCVVRIQDFGNGFVSNRKEENHFGMSIMKERAKLIHADFQVHSKLDVGTTIEIMLEEAYE